VIITAGTVGIVITTTADRTLVRSPMMPTADGTQPVVHAAKDDKRAMGERRMDRGD
jgi:hypothetical protein